MEHKYICYIAVLIFAFIIGISDFKLNKRRIKRKSIIDIFKDLSECDFMKKFQYKIDSKEYKKTQLALKQAGLKQISVPMFQLIKCITPIFSFIFMVAIKYTNIVNSLMNVDKLEKLAKIVGKEATQVNTDLNIIPLLGVALIFYYLPDIILKAIIGYRNIVGIKEVMMLHTYTVMMLKSKRSVKQILISLMKRAKIYKEPLELTVNSYSKDPHQTLENLVQEIANPQFQKVCIGLQQALNSDPNISIRYLENHRALGRELNRINRKRKNTQKNMIGILLLVLPMLGLAVVGGYPWLIFALKQLDSVPM